MSNSVQPPATASSTVTIWRHWPSAQRIPFASAAWETSTCTFSDFGRPLLNRAPVQNGCASWVTEDGVEK